MTRTTNVKRYLRKTQSGRRKPVKKHKRIISSQTKKVVPREVQKGIKYGEDFVYGFLDASGNLVGDPVTVVQDAMGNLHVWEGVQKIKQTGRYTFEDLTGKEAPLFFQIDTDIEEFLRNVPQEARENIEGGYTTFVAEPMGYFG
jgi:hypothetical protein